MNNITFDEWYKFYIWLIKNSKDTLSLTKEQIKVLFYVYKNGKAE